MASRDDKPAPLEGATDSDVNRLVDDVLRSGKHLTLPGDVEPTPPERLHVGVIAQQMKRLAQQISARTPAAEAPDDHDEWWFEVDGKRIGPISLRKIRFLWDEGELTPDSLCWHDGFPKWVSLFKVSDLAEALTPKVKVDVSAAAKALHGDPSGEWKSPAASAIEESTRRRLESSQRTEPLPLGTPLDVSDQTAAAYTALRSVPIDDEPDDAPRRGGIGHALLSGLVAGVIASGTLVALRFAWPVTVPQPIVVTMTAPAAPAPPPVIAAPAPAPVPVPVPVPAAAPAPAPAPKAAAPEAAKQPATVDDAFANTFTQPPPDELSFSEVLEVVRAHQAEIDACGTGGERKMIGWTVAPNGRVTDLSPSSGSPHLECLAKAITGWTFPKHAAGRSVEVPFKY